VLVRLEPHGVMALDALIVLNTALTSATLE
jgi:hypothetical protein